VKIIRKNHVDILCTHGYKSTACGFLAALICGIPILSYSRGFTAENRKVAFYEWVERSIQRFVTIIIAVSNGQKVKLEKFGIQRTPIEVIYNAIHTDDTPVPKKEGALVLEKLRREFDIPRSAVIVVAAGRFSPEKGHRFLVEALVAVKKEVPDLVVVLCGSGVLAGELERQAARLGVDTMIRFAGFRSDMDSVYSAMDFLVLPSLTEGLPNVILESFAAHRTVVATSVGGVPELVENGVNGYTVESARPDLLAEKIIDLALSQSKRDEFGEKGYNTVVSRFSFVDQNRHLEALYKSIVKKGALMSGCTTKRARRRFKWI
jgi:glycosyltransferase involved in cell wall biosynthesis